MMQRVVVGAVFLISLLAGCSSVVTVQPLPQTRDQREHALLEGEWLSEDSVVSLRFASDGVGRIAALDWRDDRFQIEEARLMICKGVAGSYFTVRVREHGAWEDNYYFARYRLTSRGDLLVWVPTVDVFRAAVAAGRLEGTVAKGKWGTSVTVTSAPEKLLAFLEGRHNGNLFEWEEPIILRRLFP